MSAVKNHSRKSGMPSLDEVRRVLFYDGSELVWKVRRGKAKAGSVAGCIRRSDGYRQVGIDGVRLLAHRVVWALVHGEWPERIIDHINGDKTDNRVENLRLADDSQNSANSRVSKNNRLGVKGVYMSSSGKFVAQKGVKGERSYLGSFDTIEEAHAAFCKKATEVHGEFANFG